MDQIRAANELGMRNVQYYRPPNESHRSENPAALPGTPTSDRGIEQTEVNMRATKPGQTQDTYRIVGSTINVQA